jgi:hypothetical protein
MRRQSHDDSPKAPCGCGHAPAPRAVAPCGQAEPGSSRSAPQEVDPEPDASGAFPIPGFASGQNPRRSGVRPVPIAPARNPPGRAPEPIPDPERLGETGVEVWLAKHLLFHGDSADPFKPYDPFAPRSVFCDEPARVVGNHGRHPDCSHESVIVPIESVEPLRIQVCAIDLGTTREPSVQNGPFGRGRLRAILPISYKPDPAEDSLSAIAAMFPEIAARASAFRAARPNVEPRMGPGLFFTEDRYQAIVGLSLRVIRTFPEILMPRRSLAHCLTSSTELSQYTNVVTVREGNPVYGNPVRASRQDILVVGGVVTGIRTAVDTSSSMNYIGFNPPGGDRFFLAPVIDLDCALADYFFWWAHRLRLWTSEFPGFSSSGSNFVDIDLWRRHRDWYAMMSDLCARLAMAHTMRIGGVVIHEMLHRHTRYHCARPVRGARSPARRDTDQWMRNKNFGCCQDRVQRASLEACRALFGLPLPSGRFFDGRIDNRDQYIRSFLQPWSNRSTSRCGNSGSSVRTEALHSSFLGRRHCVNITSTVQDTSGLTNVIGLCGAGSAEVLRPFCNPMRSGATNPTIRITASGHEAGPDPDPVRSLRPDHEDES